MIYSSIQIQTILMPISFGLLFLLMLLYWSQAAIFSYIQYTTLTSLLLIVSILSLTGLLLLRWVESGHFPLSNLYESLVFLSWSFLITQLVLQVNSRNSLQSNQLQYSSLSRRRNSLQIDQIQVNDEMRSVTKQSSFIGDQQKIPWARSERSNPEAEHSSDKVKLKSFRPTRSGKGNLNVVQVTGTSRSEGLPERSSGYLNYVQVPERSRHTRTCENGLPEPERSSGNRNFVPELHSASDNEKVFSGQQSIVQLGQEGNAAVTQLDLLGVITSPMALLTYSFAFFTLPKEMQKATALVPALQSNWLMMHVSIMILSYAALLCGSIISMAFLLLTFITSSSSLPFNTFARNKSTREKYLNTFASVYNVSNSQSSTNSKEFDPLSLINLRFDGLTAMNLRFKEFYENVNPIQAKYGSVSLENQSDSVQLDISSNAYTEATSNNQTLIEGQEFSRTRLKSSDNFPADTSQLVLTEKLDNLSYRLLGLGFPLLTIGILSGAVWANEAWGSYWSWDPKETWALITWLVFAIYLHARITKGWSGRKPALIATVGFFVVWFCYLGVNLLGTGLHSYGWFSNTFR